MELPGQSLRASVRFRKKESEVTQSCPTLCDPVDCSLPGSSIHGLFKARVLEGVVISFSRGSAWFRDRTRVSHIAGRCFTFWATREAHRFQRWDKLYHRLTNPHIYWQDTAMFVSYTFKKSVIKLWLFCQSDRLKKNALICIKLWEN